MARGRSPLAGRLNISAPNRYSLPIRVSAVFVVTLFSLTALAKSIDVPMRFEPGYLHKLISSTVYTEANETARIWDDGSGCNFLVLSEPEISLQQNGLRIMSRGNGRVGKPIGENCLLPISWIGFVEVLEQPRLSADGTAIEFQVTDSNLYKDDKTPGIQSAIWNWVKRYAHPRLERVRIDLRPALAELRALIPAFLSGRAAEDMTDLVASIRLSRAHIAEDTLTAVVSFQVSDMDIGPIPQSQAPLSAAELDALHDAWRRWDAFTTFIIKHTALATKNTTHRDELFDLLIDARYKLFVALTDQHSQDTDPVRALFLTTWRRLAPIMRTVSIELGGDQALHFLSFVAAADALQAVDEFGPTVGWRVSSDALRRMARLMLPQNTEDPLEYSERLDPDLRDAFDFPLLPKIPLDPQTRRYRPLRFVASAWAGNTTKRTDNPKLNPWVPRTDELPVYLSRVRHLLHDTVNEALREKPLEPEYHPLYRSLVLATAWQETCWRQFLLRKGKIQPMRSHAGAVGIMQVVPAVWRGFYDPRALENDIAYNAAAGSEILRHYLERYALRKGEHRKTGNVDNLARATYAAYNGGPSHLARYRKADTNKSLQRIDQEFWDKYKKIKSGDELAVISCYAT